MGHVIAFSKCSAQHADQAYVHRRLLYLLGPSQDTLVGVSVCNILATFAAKNVDLTTSKGTCICSRG